MTSSTSITNGNEVGRPTGRKWFSEVSGEVCQMDGQDVRVIASVNPLSEFSREQEVEATRLIAAALVLLTVCDQYAEQYCEGWCRESGGSFTDCGGCKARLAAEAARGTAP